MRDFIQTSFGEAWVSFYQGLDLGFTLATVGTYGAAKTALQVGTTYTIGMSLDYMIRLGINSLVKDDFMTAVENTSLSNYREIKKYGIDSESLLELIKLLFVSPGDEILKNQLIDYIN